MSDEKKPTFADILRREGPLAACGETMIANGYNIVPIAVGKKAPGFDNWEKTRANKRVLKEWLSDGHEHSGVGILTKDTPGIDLDIRDKDVAEAAEEKVRELFGDAPVRIGMAPKRLLLFRTDTPFKKMRSNKYIDEWDELHQIEILGDGQQFVAYHTHPDTGKPYVWTEESLDKHGHVIDAGGPMSIESYELPLIDVDKCRELIAWFEERAEQEGWKIHKRRSSGLTGNVDDPDNPFIEDARGIEIDDDELRNRLMMVPGADDYDTWFQVGMALYHQFDGEDKGLELWHEWSETADNYDADGCDRKWDTFGIEGKKRAPITARYIIKMANEAVAETTAALSLKLRDMFNDAKTLADWNKARDAAREAEIDSLARSALASLAKERLDFVNGGAKTPLSEVKKAIAFQPGKAEKTPGWCESWVYDTSDDKFFCTERKIMTTKQGFDAMYDRKAMTKRDVLDGKSAPSSSASDLALNLYRIPVVHGRRYEPGRDAVFHTPEGIFANTYREHEIPELPDKLLPRDKTAIKRVKAHIAHLLTSEREQRLLLDWLSWVVQNPGKHVNWSILLQGTEGDGKSFFGFLMRAVMGVSNVRMLNAHVLEHPFTDWAVGQCLVCVEEVRLIKHQNKYEIINRMKPYITNDVIEVHPKGKPPHDALNTSSYLFFSNFRDALPLDDDGRRYCVLFSQWQRKDLLQEFKDEHPDYYDNLYDAIATSAPALRKWLLEHEQAEDFKPKGDAPNTDARQYMIRQAQPEFIQSLDDLISDGVHALISERILSLSVMEYFFSEAGFDIPQPKALTSMLTRARYDNLGRIRLNQEFRDTFFSRDPHAWRISDKENKPITDTAAIREFVKKVGIPTEKTVWDDDEL